MVKQQGQESLLKQQQPKASGQTYNDWTVYGQSKTANILFTVHCNTGPIKPDIKSLAVHAGIIDINLTRYQDTKEIAAMRASVKVQLKTRNQGASTTLVAALDPKSQRECTADQVYLLGCQFTPVLSTAAGLQVAKALWQLGNKLVGARFEGKSSSACTLLSLYYLSYECMSITVWPGHGKRAVMVENETLG